MNCEGCDRAKDAAVKTLERLGYTYHGGEQWKPSLGEKPDFDGCALCRSNTYPKSFYEKTVCINCVQKINDLVLKREPREGNK